VIDLKGKRRKSTFYLLVDNSWYLARFEDFKFFISNVEERITGVTITCVAPKNEVITNRYIDISSFEKFETKEIGKNNHIIMRLLYG